MITCRMIDVNDTDPTLTTNVHSEDVDPMPFLRLNPMSVLVTTSLDFCMILPNQGPSPGISFCARANFCFTCRSHALHRNTGIIHGRTVPRCVGSY